MSKLVKSVKFESDTCQEQDTMVLRNVVLFLCVLFVLFRAEGGGRGAGA